MMALDTIPKAEARKRHLLKEGYDGIVQKESEGRSNMVQVVAFTPEQIKSATGNRGTFDPSNPDIRYLPAERGERIVEPGTLEALEVRQSLDKEGNPKFIAKKDSYGNPIEGKSEPVYESIDYDLLGSPLIRKHAGQEVNPNATFDFDSLPYRVTKPKQKEILAALRSGALDSVSDALVAEYQRMVTDKQVAAGAGWYSRMRAKIKQALGKQADFFSQLLGATSAQTPVEANFNQAFEAFTLSKRGKYKAMVKRYLEGVNLMDKGQLELVALQRRIVSKRELKGKSKAERDKYIMRAWVKRYDLIPKRLNGKKYNANSSAVLRVLAGTWLQATGSPKTPNFSGNLSGRTIQATIDVWAARMMRRVMYSGERQWRIQPKSETGVTNHDFAVGQIVFKKAADKLGINPDDLQAIVWFGEKKVWDTNKWTGEVGAFKSSFDEPFDVYFPQGRSPRKMKEGQNIIRFLGKERKLAKARDMKENPSRYGKTSDYAKATIKKARKDLREARQGRGVRPYITERRRLAGR
jgi:hypothetical protein